MRRGFDHTKDQTDAPKTGAQLLPSCACFADGCKMPGTINTGGRSWSCAWHYGAMPEHIPRITQTLRDWECITSEIRIGRKLLNTAANGAVVLKAYGEAVERVLAATASGGWGDELAGSMQGSYSGWLQKLSLFLQWRIAVGLGTATEKDKP